MNLDLRLNLDRPIVFLKVATTGDRPIDKKDSAEPVDRIIEISLVRMDTDRTVKKGTRLINPGMRIPNSITSLCGITDDMVMDKPKFEDIAPGLYSFIGDSDLAGFNISKFDLQFLSEEFNRAGIPFSINNRRIIDLSSIFHQMEKRDFNSAVSKFTENNVTGPLSSDEHNNLSIQVFNGMVANYSFDDRFKNPTAQSLNDSFNENRKSLDVGGNIVLNESGRPIFTFGKYKGKIVSEIMISDKNYYKWCVEVSDLPMDTKLIIKRIVEKASNVQNQN